MNNQVIIMKEDAIALFGSKSNLARALGIYRQAVSQWRDGHPIPQVQAMKIRYQLKPEQFGPAE